MTVPADSARVDGDGESGWLTARQVADALSVKRETVYAYVSRGLLHRTLALDGRTSLFDPDEVEQLRLGRRGDTRGELTTVLATGITRITEGQVLIRGRDLVVEVAGGAGFVDVADLIWEADSAAVWPTLLASGSDGEFESWEQSSLMPLDRFRVALATAASADPFRQDLSPSVVRRTGARLIGAMVTSLPRHRPSPSDRSPEPADPPSADPEAADRHTNPGAVVGAALWPRLTPAAPEPAQVRCLDAALALLADHGLATSTFAARVAASTRADPYAVVAAGLGALAGPLHGGASTGVHRALEALATEDDPARPGLEATASAHPLAGFGHRLYRRTDPRFALLVELITDAWAGDERLDVYRRYREDAGGRTADAPNIDLALGLLTWLAGTGAEAGEVIFAVARTAGWIGHAMEEYLEQPVRLRPRSHYVGPQPQPRPRPR